MRSSLKRGGRIEDRIAARLEAQPGRPYAKAENTHEPSRAATSSALNQPSSDVRLPSTSLDADYIDNPHTHAYDSQSGRLITESDTGPGFDLDASFSFRSNESDLDIHDR